MSNFCWRKICRRRSVAWRRSPSFTTYASLQKGCLSTLELNARGEGNIILRHVSKMGLRKERGRVDAPLWLGTFFLFSIAFFQRLVSMRSAPFSPSFCHGKVWRRERRMKRGAGEGKAWELAGERWIASKRRRRSWWWRRRRHRLEWVTSRALRRRERTGNGRSCA